MTTSMRFGAHGRRLSVIALGGLLAFDGVKLLEYLHGYGEVVFLEFENRLWVVKQDVRIEHEGLNFCRNPKPRIWGYRPAQVFHRVWISC